MGNKFSLDTHYGGFTTIIVGVPHPIRPLSRGINVCFCDFKSLRVLVIHVLRRGGGGPEDGVRGTTKVSEPGTPSGRVEGKTQSSRPLTRL